MFILFIKVTQVVASGLGAKTEEITCIKSLDPFPQYPINCPVFSCESRG